MIYAAVIRNAAKADVIFPFVETEEKYKAIFFVGGTKIDFDALDCEDFCRDYGSFLTKNVDE